MRVAAVQRLAFLAVVLAGSLMAVGEQAKAQEPTGHLVYDISWPQCPTNLPQGGFHFAVIGLNNGYPFSTNDCFAFQYAWAATVEANPDVYINLDFPSPGDAHALHGPYGRCAETDDWCRAYNHGYALAADNVRRTMYFGVSPGRYWFDVEMINDWSPWREANGQVVHGAVDYFLEHNIPIGIYGTNYQWGLITGHYMPEVSLPIWVAGATSIEMAAERCLDETKTFAGGVTWMVQYPEGPYDGNVLCEPGKADRESRLPGSVVTAAAAQSQTGPIVRGIRFGDAHGDADGGIQLRRTPKTLQEALSARQYTVRIQVSTDR